MSSVSENSEDTDEFIQSIRTELEQCPVYPGEQLIQEEPPPSHLDSPLSSPIKAAQYSTDEDAALDRDIEKILDTFGHGITVKTLDGYMTDDEYEIELNLQRDSRRIDAFELSDTLQSPFNSTPQHRIIDSEPLLYSKPPSPPEVFMTPMQHYSPGNNWNEKEIQSLKSRIHRQTVYHKSELDEHLTREREARAKLEISHKENQSLMKAMKAQLVSLQQKIREMQSEKVRLAQDCQQQIEMRETPQEDLNKFKEIADYYMGIAKEQDRKIINLEQLIHGLNAEINQLTSRIAEKDKEMCQLNENLKEQARNFASDKFRKESETQDMLNKTQKTQHREKVLSVAKLQEDLSQTHNEEISQLRNSLHEDKNRALSRLEEGYIQKITKAEEITKKLEKDLESSARKIEAKDDNIKSIEIQHKKEVHQLSSEIQKLQSSLQRNTKDLTQSRSQAVARARQETEHLTLQRIQLAVESSHKSHQVEIQKMKANLKRVTDELSGVREQNAELVRRDKERLVAHTQFEQRLALQLADELNAHSHIGIATNRQRRGAPPQRRYSGSMTCLSEIQSPKESAESILRVLRVANGDLRKRAKEAEQKIESQQRKIKQMDSDHQSKLKQLRRDSEYDSNRNDNKEKSEVTNKKRIDSDLKELETSNTSLREYIHTLEEERKTAEDNVMNDSRVVEAVTLLSKLQRRLQIITADRSNLQGEILKLRELIEKHNMKQSSPISPQIFNEKILEYSTLQNKYKILLREKMDLERSNLELFV